MIPRTPGELAEQVRHAQVLDLAQREGPTTLARRVLELEAEVARLRATAVTGGPGVALALGRFADLLGSLDALIRAGRRGELSMHGLVPVTALVELLDAARPQRGRSGEPITGSESYGAPDTDPGSGTG